MAATAVSERAIVKWGIADHQLTEFQRWMTFASMFFFGFITVFSMMKANIVLTDVGAVFGMDMSDMGNIPGFFSIAGLIITMPGVWIMRNLGIKFSLIATAVITLVGSLIGVFATNSGMFLFSRVLEGAGMGMISVVGPNVMPRLFPVKKLGLVMGIWSQWVCGGIIIASVIAPMLFVNYGWESIWWLSIVLEAIALVWMLACCKFNKVPENEIQGGDVTKKKTRHTSYIFAGIVVGLSFVAWAAIYGTGVNTFYPTFLQEAKGFAVTLAGLPTMVISIVTIPLGIIAGILMDKTNLRKWSLVAGYILIAALMGFVAWAGGEQQTTVWVFAVLMGVAAALIPTATRAIIPVLVTEPRRMDYILAVMALTTYVGGVVAGPYGGLIANVGFQDAALFSLAPGAFIVAIILAIAVKSDKKVLDEDAKLQAEEDAGQTV